MRAFLPLALVVLLPALVPPAAATAECDPVGIVCAGEATFGDPSCASGPTLALARGGAFTSFACPAPPPASPDVAWGALLP